MHIKNKESSHVVSPFYLKDVLQADLDKDTLCRIGPVRSAVVEKSDVILTASLIKQRSLVDRRCFIDAESLGLIYIRLRLYNDNIVRLMISRDNAAFKDDSHMLDFDAELTTVPCQLKQDDSGWCARDTYIPRFAVGRKHFAPHIYPDKKTEVHFQDADYFFTEYWDALSAFLLVRVAGPVTFGFSLQIETDEHFCGTGERFYRIDLFGRSIDLVNENAHGVNTPRSYKNVPFLLSSRPYGVFVHSAAKMKLDIGAHSSRSLQWFVEEDNLDIFFIGGGSFQQIIQNYQKITGFPSMPPLWSFGTWMSRCTYESEQEVSQIAKRLREENYPVDVLHLDPGWFAEDWANNWWKCSWTFNLKAFPDPSRFMQHMRQQGFHISIWIYGFINPEVELSKTARENEYVGKITDPDTGVEWGDTLDFSNPDTIKWYKDLLKPLLRFGVATFKTDFGENIDESAIYKNIAPPKYRNLFGHLFQKATWETIAEMTGEPIIWARSGWAGSQRYPIHWSADCSSTFDGVANSLWGGLQIGLSGFAFWSHDIGGFYALKDAMTVKPDEILYLRWTQHGVFSSHMRYHGLTPREPWEYPGVADIVRQWLRFRYSLIPYIVAESDRCCKSGLPLLRALVFDWTDDPAVWCISDQYLFGSDFMICPVFNKSGIRNVYLPEGKWIDLWSGASIRGPIHLKKLESEPARLPVYVRQGAEIEFAEPVQCTDELTQARRFMIRFDEDYCGFENSELGTHIKL